MASGNDPDLFVAMGLFENGIGPDRISGMATNVILPDLLVFNARILKEIKLPTKNFTLVLKNGKDYQAELPINPFEKSVETPIILVPADICATFRSRATGQMLLLQRRKTPI